MREGLRCVERLRLIGLAASLALPFALGAVQSAAADEGLAEALEVMTAEDRAAFDGAVRDYLLRNPEIMIEVFGILETRQRAAEEAAQEAALKASEDALLNDGYSYVGGNPEGDVTIVEFLDYRCGYCRKAHPEMMQLLKEDGNIRYIVKEFPVLGEESLTASRLALATLMHATGEDYAALMDVLMGFNAPLTAATMTAILDDLVDAKMRDQILASMESDLVRSRLAQNHQLANTLELTGTPAFVINGILVGGYISSSEMRQIIEEARGK